MKSLGILVFIVICLLFSSCCSIFGKCENKQNFGSDTNCKEITSYIENNEKITSISRQQNGDWCWIAVTQMFLKHNNSIDLEQCKIINDNKNLERSINPNEDCCNNHISISGFKNEKCNFPGDVRQLLDRYQFVLNYEFSNPLSFEQIKNKIVCNQIIPYAYKFRNNSAHVVLIVGYREIGNDKILIVYNSDNSSREVGKREEILYDKYQNKNISLGGSRYYYTLIKTIKKKIKKFYK